jgi:hypothetical protein
MVLVAVIAWFVLCIAGVYVGLRVICFLKREYAQAENMLLRGIVGAITFFEEICATCKKGCEDHPLLVRRAVRIGLLIATVSTAAWFLARC